MSNPQEPSGQVAPIAVRRIACSRCAGNGVIMVMPKQSPLEVNKLPPQQVVCNQCQGQRYIEVLVPMPTNE